MTPILIRKLNVPMNFQAIVAKVPNITRDGDALAAVSVMCITYIGLVDYYTAKHRPADQFESNR